MQVQLVMIKADGTRKEFPLDKQRVVIGRTRDCDLRIPLASVSRQHCELQIEGESIRLRDLGSSNGTFHNSNKVLNAELEPGDEIGVGPVVLTVEVQGQAEGVLAPVAPASAAASDTVEEEDLLPMLDQDGSAASAAVENDEFDEVVQEIEVEDAVSLDDMAGAPADDITDVTPDALSEVTPEETPDDIATEQLVDGALGDEQQEPAAIDVSDDLPGVSDAEDLQTDADDDDEMPNLDALSFDDDDAQQEQEEEISEELVLDMEGDEADTLEEQSETDESDDLAALGASDEVDDLSAIGAADESEASDELAEIGASDEVDDLTNLGDLGASDESDESDDAVNLGDLGASDDESEDSEQLIELSDAESEPAAETESDADSDLEPADLVTLKPEALEPHENEMPDYEKEQYTPTVELDDPASALEALSRLTGGDDDNNDDDMPLMFEDEDESK